MRGLRHVPDLFFVFAGARGGAHPRVEKNAFRLHGKRSEWDQYFMMTRRVCVNSSMPCLPSSPPRPERFQPAWKPWYGSAGVRFTYSSPASMLFATFIVLR